MDAPLTAWIFLGVVVAIAAQRLWELRISDRNETALRAQGGYEVGAGHMNVMRLLHTAWLVAMPLEVFLLDRPFVPWLAALAAVGLNGSSLQRSRDVLREVGNVSSVSVLLILDEVMRETPPPGTWGLMMAMGPAFCAELVLLRW